jgi:hypothetical protein
MDTPRTLGPVAGRITTRRRPVDEADRGEEREGPGAVRSPHGRPPAPPPFRSSTARSAAPSSTRSEKRCSGCIRRMPSTMTCCERSRVSWSSRSGGWTPERKGKRPSQSAARTASGEPSVPSNSHVHCPVMLVGPAMSFTGIGARIAAVALGAERRCKAKSSRSARIRSSSRPAGPSRRP